MNNILATSLTENFSESDGISVLYEYERVERGGKGIFQDRSQAYKESCPGMFQGPYSQASILAPIILKVDNSPIIFNNANL